MALTLSQPATRAVVRLPADDARDLGGKAGNLSRLMRLELPVPRACVVPAAVFAAHLAPLRASHGTAPEALRAALLRAPLPADLLAALADALAWLGDVPLAVRSSALDEDGADRSFAGQHDTVLDVRGLDAVADAVRRCWASAFAPRALEYRAAAGAAATDPAMAVVVQRLVRARASGVLFTRDPSASGVHAPLLIEAVPGLGEALVAGRATPDRFAVARDTRAVTALARDAGAPVDDAALRELARLALRVESAFGAPQDIEWAVDDATGALALLQARPITAVAARHTDGLDDHDDDAADEAAAGEPDARRYVWSNTNAGELLPGLATPMTVAVCDRFVRDFILPIVELFGIDAAGAPLIGRVAGRAYFCMNTFAALMTVVPGARGKSPAELFGGDGELIARALAEASPRARPVVRWRVGRAVAGVPRLLARLVRHHRVEPVRAFAAMQARTRALAADDLAALDDAALAARPAAILDVGDRAWTECLAALMVGIALLEAHAALCRRWLGDADGSRANTLLAGLGGVESALAGMDLWAVVDAARAPDVAPLLRAGASFDAVRPALDARPGGREFLSRWDRYMARHGHHARGELDVAVARFAEEPDVQLATVRALLDAPPDADPARLHARRAGQRERLEAASLAALGPVRRAVFRAVLARARRGVAWRENIKSEVIRRVALVRAAVLAVGARWAARGRLDAPDDVFFLTLAELRAAAASPAHDVRALVARRRREHARYAAVVPPQVIIGRFDPRTAAPAPPPSGARVLRGIAVSAGVVEGRARVILATDRDERVRAGEILVAPFTDPGWAPHFLAAAGLVVDMGGVLSHGSIVAREMGIPAVVNVREGTRAIRTGQRVRVDGVRGEVHLLDDPPPASP